MARIYAQLGTLVFFIVAIGGFFLGTASNIGANGLAEGNLGNLTLHMTYTRDVIDAILLVLFIYVGFAASRTTGRWIVLGCGAFLLLLGIVGFIHGDTPTASQSIAGLNFPSAVNVFDTFFGVLGILAALGTLSDDDLAAHENKSFLREG